MLRPIALVVAIALVSEYGVLEVELCSSPATIRNGFPSTIRRPVPLICLIDDTGCAAEMKKNEAIATMMAGSRSVMFMIPEDIIVICKYNASLLIGVWNRREKCFEASLKCTLKHG